VERSEEVDVADGGLPLDPGITVPVERSLEVTIVGKDETGADVRYELDGLRRPAVCSTRPTTSTAC